MTNRQIVSIERQIVGDKRSIDFINNRIKSINSIRQFRQVKLPPEMIDHILSFLPVEDVQATDEELEYLIEMKTDLMKRIEEYSNILVQQRERRERQMNKKSKSSTL